MADSNTLLFYVATEQGSGVSVQSPITGEITGGGTKLRIQIPQELRQPVPGVDASLTGLDQLFTAKKGKKYLVSSTGCSNKKWKFDRQADVHEPRGRRRRSRVRSARRRRRSARSSAPPLTLLCPTAPHPRGRRRF